MTYREDAQWLGLAQLVADELRGRVAALANRSKKHAKLASMFSHGIVFNRSFVKAIGKFGTIQETVELLNTHGSPSEVLNLNHENDGRGEWKSLNDAMSDCFGFCSGEIISCLPGKLLFYESEEPEHRAVVFKPN